jgi:hypothetical protein
VSGRPTLDGDPTTGTGRAPVPIGARTIGRLEALAAEADGFRR